MEHTYYIFFKNNVDEKGVQAPLAYFSDLDKAKEKCVEYADLFTYLVENGRTDVDTYKYVTVDTYCGDTHTPVFVREVTALVEKPLTFADLKSLLNDAENDFGDISNYVINIVDATSHMKAHNMSYVEVDTEHKVIDIGFYK